MRLKQTLLSILATSTIVLANSTIQTQAEHVRVTRSEPIYEQIQEKIPYQECWNEQVPTQSNHGNIISDNIGTLIGGIAGGILGHQVGGGSGKTVATIGGAILGSAVGNRVSNRQYPQRVAYETVKRCKTNYRYNSLRELVGYNNIGYYKGQKIVKFSPQKLRTIPITLSISY